MTARLAIEPYPFDADFGRATSPRALLYSAIEEERYQKASSPSVQDTGQLAKDTTKKIILFWKERPEQVLYCGEAVRW